MTKRSLLALILIVQLVLTALGQTPATAPTSAPQQQQPGRTDDDEVVRITTNLVQVDAVVTDKKGRIVTDLSPEDFEITEDGRSQKITNFSYVELEPAAATEAAAPAPAADKTAPPAPPVRLKPEQVRRTVALVVDDLGLSFESTHHVQRALKKFVDEQMQPGDLVAIIRTAGGMGALQQFTSDKRQLYAAIERVRFNLTGRGSIGAFPALEGNPVIADIGGQSPSMMENIKEANEDADAFREDLFAVGTLGALNYVVRGLRELPGRKSVLLFSDGLQLQRFSNSERNVRVFEAVNSLTDLANRASVVIYTMDARGLQTLGLTAADDTSGMSADQVAAAMTRRRGNFFESQGGLIYLAERTGGLAIRNENDLGKGIKRVLEDQKGYYLIGYRPDDSTFETVKGRRRFHHIDIKVKRPGLSVRHRTGFYGVTDEEARPARRTREAQLVGALSSPFGASGVHVRLTSFFGNDVKAGSYMRSFLHVDARDLTFKELPNGRYESMFDVLAFTFGDNGTIVDQVGRTFTVRVSGETYRRFLQNGFVCTLYVPIKKAGAYQLRVALRDTASERIGSAGQFIEVPNIGKNRLALSGLIVTGVDSADLQPDTSPAGAGATPSSTPGADADAKANTDVEEKDAQTSAAVRQFRRGSMLQFGYFIYNAQTDKAAGRPQPQAQVRVFRDGQEVYAGKPVPVNLENQPDLKRIGVTGALQLGSSMLPGEYILQIVVTDPLARNTKYRTATQWIDFEIVK
jgi:VWFA-related protein